MLAALLAAALLTLALPAASAQASPATATCNVDDFTFGSGCSVTFPDTATGDTSTITVTLNAGLMSGNGPVALSSTDPYYTLSNDTCTGTTLSMGASCTFDLVFAPLDDGTPATHARATAGLDVSEGGMPDGTLNIDAQQHTGSGGGGGTPPTPSYSGSVAPASKDFGSATVGAGVSQTFTLTGTSTDPLQVTGVAIVGTDTGDYTIDSDTCTGATLSQSDTCAVGVTFAAPSSNGPQRASSATLAFASNADTAIGVALSGTVLHQARPGGTVTAGGGSFSGVTAGTTATKTYTLTGTASDPLTVTASSIGGADATDYRIVSDGCDGHTLNLADTCTITVRFAPAATSASRSSTAELDVASDAVSVISAPLSGTVVAVPAPNPALSYALGDSPFNGGDRIVFTNSGNVPLHLTGATVAGQGAVNVVLTGDDCRDVTLAVGATCDIGVKTNVILAGPIHATITVGGDATASLTIGSAGSTVALSTDPGDSTSTAAVGEVVRKTYTFKNGSAIGAHLTGATASGDAGFAVTADTCRDVTLAAGGACTVDTAFTMSSAGTHAGTLKVDGEGAGGSVTTSVTATAASITLPQELPQAPAAPPTNAAAKDAGALFGQLSSSGSGVQPQFSGGSSFTPTKDVVAVAVVHNGQVVATDRDAKAFAIAVLTAGPDDEIVAAGVPLSASMKASLIAFLRATTDLTATSAAAAVKKVARPKIIGKTCANGRCKVKLQWPETPGVYGATIAVGHKATGKADGYAIAAVVLPHVTVPKSLPTCVTLGQRASTSSVKLGVSPATKVTWTLSAAARQPREPRGCADSKRWPALKASSKTLAGGVVDGGSPSRTTSMAKILNNVRLAKLKPGFYRVRFAATSAGLAAAAPADWWIQVLPREAAAGS